MYIFLDYSQFRSFFLRLNLTICTSSSVIFLSLVEFRPRQPVRLEGAVRTRVRDFEAGPNGKRYKTSAAAEKACQAHI